jgi:CRISPR system Cascade subunit CasB
MSSTYQYLDESQCSWLREWCRAMQSQDAENTPVRPALRHLGRGDRAKLKRCTSIEELETESAANLLVSYLSQDAWEKRPRLKPWLREHDYGALFLIAGVLTHVKKDAGNGKSLAWRVGNANTSKGAPVPMSELRFKRLLRTRDIEDFYRQARRAVQLANGDVDAAVLADDLLAWCYEESLKTRESRPSNSLKFRWARDYYLTAKEHRSSEESS